MKNPHGFIRVTWLDQMKFGSIESDFILVRVGFDPFRGISKKNHNYVQYCNWVSSILSQKKLSKTTANKESPAGRAWNFQTLPAGDSFEHFLKCPKCLPCCHEFPSFPCHFVCLFMRRRISRRAREVQAFVPDQEGQGESC